jgi:hypothetical protein
MSEAMALERMTQMLAELEGYLTAMRVPYLRRYAESGGKGCISVLGQDFEVRFARRHLHLRAVQV